MRFSLLILLFMLVCNTSFASNEFRSGNKRVNLLEFYTSEGCSSCPPADRWFSKLKSHKKLWKELIPVAFHVDYWDYIGWTDRSATPEYSLRQKKHALEKNLSTVYTPGFILNGEEWRSFFGLRRLSLDNDTHAGELLVKVNQDKLHAVYSGHLLNSKSLVLNIAVLGFDVKTDVKTGENAGRQLTHDFVVLGYKTSTMGLSGQHFEITTTLPSLLYSTPQTGIAVWVNESTHLRPVQATGGWLN